MKPTSGIRIRPMHLGALAGVLLLLPGISWAETHIVMVGNNFFSPSTLTIAVGDTVEWQNPAGGMSHNVTSNTGAFPASPTAGGFTYSFTFNSAGTFGYHCTIHGSATSGMRGTITVQASTDQPDLLVQTLDATNGTYAPGDAIPISTTIQNSGTAASGAFNVTFYASTNSGIGPSDTALGTSARSSIAAGASSSFNFNGTIPNGLADGDYFIGAIIDINDSNTANNTGADPTPVAVQAPVNPGFQINNTLNDAWGDPNVNKQGFFITVFPDIQKIFLSWFTYDTERPAGGVTAMLGEPGHRWLTAFGSYSGDGAILDIELTQGGIFDANPPDPPQSPYGTIELLFNNCNQAELAYEIPSLGLSRLMIIQRTYASPDILALCEASQAP